MQPIWVRSSINSFNSASFFEIVGDTFFSGMNLFNLVFISRLWHSSYALQALNLCRNSSSKQLSAQSYGIPTIQLLAIRKTPHHSFSRQHRARKWGKGEEDSFKYLPLRRFLIVTVFSDRSPSGVIVYQSGRSGTEVFPTASLRVDSGPVQVAILPI